MRRALAGISIAILTAGLSGVGRADAATCPAGQVCLYQNIVSGGEQLNTSGTWSTVGPYNDWASSITNNTGVAWCFYENDNYGGTPKFFVVPARRAEPNLGNYTIPNRQGATWNDRISSFLPSSGGTCPFLGRRVSVSAVTSPRQMP